jgi:hypothetical protein
MELDFAATDGGVSSSGLVALVFGVALAAQTVLHHQETLEHVARLQAELGAASAPRRAGDARETRRQGEAIVRANEVAHELARRWDRVFLAIESASARDVALLAIEPDPRKGLVRVTAEAKGKNAMLDYVARLQAAQPLQRVMLEQHEVLSQVPEKPVRFVVSAAWVALP